MLNITITVFMKSVSPLISLQEGGSISVSAAVLSFPCTVVIRPIHVPLFSNVVYFQTKRWQTINCNGCHAKTSKVSVYNVLITLLQVKLCMFGVKVVGQNLYILKGV